MSITRSKQAEKGKYKNKNSRLPKYGRKKERSVVRMYSIKTKEFGFLIGNQNDTENEEYELFITMRNQERLWCEYHNYLHKREQLLRINRSLCGDCSWGCSNCEGWNGGWWDMQY